MALRRTVALFVAAKSAHACCQPGQSCWPSAQEWANLEASLDRSAKRILSQTNPGQASEPKQCAIPNGSNQPLGGFGAKLDPLYLQPEEAKEGTCLVDNLGPYCHITTRNSPRDGMEPAVVVWPLTREHVISSVKFADRYGICMCVTATGHDFLNRHTCNQGMMIRTSLMKESSIDLNSELHPTGVAKLGAGLTFDEAHKLVTGADRYMTSGWSKTVGVVGWAIGGGHGPHGSATGLGTDNLVEINVVVANGDLVTATAKGTWTRSSPSNSTRLRDAVFSDSTDLFWALRGGGGSTWGVITDVTYKMYPIPDGGFTYTYITWTDNLCGQAADAKKHFDFYLNTWAQARGHRWSGLAYVTGERPLSPYPCTANWNNFLVYNFHGDRTDPEYITAMDEFRAAVPRVQFIVQSFKTWWEAVQSTAVEVIYPTPASYPDGAPSVAVASSKLSGLVDAIADSMQGCTGYYGFTCPDHQLFQDIGGNMGSPGREDTPLSDGFKNAFVHFILGRMQSQYIAPFYALGSNSYMSESGWDLPNDWRDRYWGTNYARLLSIKNKVDEKGLFWCRRCVGDSDTARKARGMSSKDLDDIVPAPTSNHTHARLPPVVEGFQNATAFLRALGKA